MMLYNEVKRESQGKWGVILQSLAPDIQPAINKAPHAVKLQMHGELIQFRLMRDFELTGGSVRKPFSEAKIFSNGFSTLMECNNWDFDQAFNEVRQWHLDNGYKGTAYKRPAPKPPAKPAAPKEPVVHEQRLAKIEMLWEQGYEASSPQAKTLRTYIRSRGLDDSLIPPSIRFHPGVKFYHTPENDPEARPQFIGTYPAMLSGISNRLGKLINVQRTYLMPDGTGKANDLPEGAKPKKSMLSAIEGEGSKAAVRLDQPGPVLALTEGVETGLVVRQVTGLPVWATLSAGFLPNVLLPGMVEEVWVFADLDPVKIQGDPVGAGLMAAVRLSHRLSGMGKLCHIAVPPGPMPMREGEIQCIDWLDDFTANGTNHFPDIKRRIS